ncbi:flagellin [Modestobacter sp. I12A-02628]|nr:flagellin [Goekera deserti]MPQ99508.1 flagellin [Goekera deserti]NDI48995.1 flagellin [Goekera deserti]
MALTVNTNIAAMNAYRNLNATNDSMNKSLEKLSSGSRINRAADDAAGLAISEGMRSQIGGLKMAVRNTQDGISVVQTAEGALTETHSILQRMRDLSVQASNDAGLNADAKKNIQTEVTQLKSELDRITTTTTFNGAKLLDGSYTGKNFQVGANAGETISISIGAAGRGMNATGLGVNGVDVTSVGKYQVSAAAAAGKVSTTLASQTAASTATITVDATDASFTASGVDSFKNLKGTISFGGKSFDLGSVDYSAVTATGAAGASAASAALNAAAQSAFGTSAAFTVAPTTIVFNAGNVAAANTATMGSYMTSGGFALSSSAADVAAATVSFTGGSGAADALTAIDKAISTVSTVRANLGALQNRFDHTINNLNVAVENLTASESRIRDTDMAQEMTNFTKSQILSQAGTAMLSQANQAPQGILSLLQ